jgi:hypothetical protein
MHDYMIINSKAAGCRPRLNIHTKPVKQINCLQNLSVNTFYAIALAVRHWILTAEAWVQPSALHFRFMVNKLALGQVPSVRTSISHCQLLSHHASWSVSTVSLPWFLDGGFTVGRTQNKDVSLIREKHTNTNASLCKAIFHVTDWLFGYLTTHFYKSDWCSGNTLDLYLGGAHSKTQLERWLLWQISMIFLSYYR